MSRGRRLGLRLLLAGAVAGGGYVGWLSTAGTPDAAQLLPAGADALVELRGARDVAARLSGTRFAAAFARSETRAWLERTDAVALLDAVRAGVGRVAGFTPRRGIVFDIVGTDAAFGRYPHSPGAAGAAPWAVAGRLSLRGWAAAAALRLARAAGLGADVVRRERVPGGTVYTLPDAGGRPLHVFFKGRAVLAASDGALVREAARAGAAGGMRRDPAVQQARDALPARGELFAWARRAALPGAGATAATPVGVVARVGSVVEIDVVAPASAGAAAAGAAGSDAPLPATALLVDQPLLFLSSRGPAPAALQGFLAKRVRAVDERRRERSAPFAAAPGRGYAVVVTGTGPGSGLFPAPRGVVMIRMSDAAAAAEAVRRAFPPDARASVVGSARTLSSRESFPLAGEFELTGAAVGPDLVLATDPSLIAAVATAAAPAAATRPDAAWQADTLAVVSVGKALPLLRRWSAPLSGLIGARWPGAPEVGADLDLLAAVRSVRVADGADGRLRRAAITLEVGDLP